MQVQMADITTTGRRVGQTDLSIQIGTCELESTPMLKNKSAGYYRPDRLDHHVVVNDLTGLENINYQPLSSNETT
jgi:hypothetical protein